MAGIFHNFPGLDDAAAAVAGTFSAPEMRAMRALAQRPNASLEVMEWAILRNENRASKEPASLGAAWTAASLASWVCSGADRVFHWGLGSRGLAPLVNRSGDGRRVQFFEQHYWNMALLELFVGGRARFTTLALPVGRNHTIAVIESVQEGDTYYALIAALGADRAHAFETEVELALPRAHSVMLGRGAVQQWRFDGSVSVVETLLAELKDRDGMLALDDGLPYDFPTLLTAAGKAYAEQPANLERYWAMHTATFQPSPFQGTWTAQPGHGTTFHVPVTAPSVTVIAARLQ